MTRSAVGRRTWRAAVLAAGLLVVLASPAAADPPGPTNYQSEVLGLDPPVDGVEARVIGGDSFLQLRVAPGREVLVRGVDDELYVRFDASGEVWENRRSIAYWWNQDRYADIDVPAATGPDVPPDWVLVSTDGTYAWHDHDIHWMSPTTMPNLADGSGRQVDPSLGVPQLTTVWGGPTFVLDGQTVTILGEVTWYPNASPLPAIVAGVALFALTLAVGLRSAGAGITVGVVTAGMLALVVSVPRVFGLEPGVQAEPVRLILPVIALAVLAAGMAARHRSTVALMVAGAAGVPLLGWAFSSLGAAVAPIVPPESLPAWLSRAAVGATLGAGLAALVLGVRDLLGRTPSDLVDSYEAG